MEHLAEILVPIACGCVLPIVAILLGVRQKMNETNKRTEIILAAIEKNPEMDVEELMEKISPKKKLLKEKILSKLQVGMIATLLGIGFIGSEMYLSIFKNSSSPMGVVGLILLPVGIAFLISYFTGKKMLAKEMEAEEQLLKTQAAIK